MADFSILKGKTLTNVEVQSCDEDKIIFTTSDGMTYSMYHRSDCCESVFLEDVCGDWNDLLNLPLLIAEEVTNQEDEPKYEGEESWTWTYYKLVTNLGAVTLRWYGSSNGYYSESVDFVPGCYGCGNEVYSGDGFCHDCDKLVAEYIPVEQKIKFWDAKYNKKRKYTIKKNRPVVKCQYCGKGVIKGENCECCQTKV
jgi:hypothetical protein